MDSETVTFIELSGPTARADLTAIADEAARRGASCELLASTAEPGLHLLVCRGTAELPGAPADARRWAFVPVEIDR